MRPAFSKDGTITAANSSSISDGAAALVLTTEEYAQSHGLNTLAKIVATSTHSQHPSEFTIAPISAIQKVFERAGWSVDEVDAWEINEAFAMVAMAPIHELGIDEAKVNVHGGACALGHPIGATGSRIILSLIYALKRLGKRKVSLPYVLVVVKQQPLRLKFNLKLKEDVRIFLHLLFYN